VVREGRLMFVAGLVMMLAAALTMLPARDQAAAQSAPPAEVTTQQIDPSSPLTLAEARAIIEGAIGYARSINQPVGVSIVDPGGHVISQDLMDGVGFGTLPHATGVSVQARLETSA
jgi:Haem-degrading